MPTIARLLVLAAARLVTATSPPTGPLSNGQLTFWGSSMANCANFFVSYGGQYCFQNCNTYYYVQQNSGQTAMSLSPQYTGTCVCPAPWTGPSSGTGFASVANAQGQSVTLTTYGNPQSGIVLTLFGPAGLQCGLKYYVSSGSVLGISSSNYYYDSSYWAWTWGWLVILVLFVFLCCCVRACMVSTYPGVVRGPPPQAQQFVQSPLPPQVYVVQGQPVQQAAPYAYPVAAQAVNQGSANVPVAQGVPVQQQQADSKQMTMV